jgi:hypothetical protein
MEYQPMGAIFFLFYIACFIFWLWMLIDLLISGSSAGTKILWVILMLFLPVLGSILYFFLARKKAL